MRNCVVKVVNKQGHVELSTFKLKHGGPFSKAEAEKWMKEEFPDAKKIVVYGPRSKMYAVYKAFGFGL